MRRQGIGIELGYLLESCCRARDIEHGKRARDIGHGKHACPDRLGGISVELMFLSFNLFLLATLF